MFRNRSSQKPTEELYADFHSNFPELRDDSTRSEGTSAPGAERAPNPTHGEILPEGASEPTQSDLMTSPSRTMAFSGGMGTGNESGGGGLDQPMAAAMDPMAGISRRDQARSSSGGQRHDSWPFTPSMLDPTSLSFAKFADQLPGAYTPTTGGSGTPSTRYHPPMADLHAIAAAGAGLDMTGFEESSASLPPGPFSSSRSGEGAMPATAYDMQHPFPGASIDVQPFSQLRRYHTPSTYASHALPATHFGPMPAPAPPTMGPAELELQGQNETDPDPDASLDPPPLPKHVSSSAEPHSQLEGDFRWRVTLNAPTAMVKATDDIPMTYLNKGQPYTMSVRDTLPGPALTRSYRSHVRIAFDDDHSRQRRAACWHLWKQGRVTSEAHPREGRLRAIEYVPPSESGEGADVEAAASRPPSVEIEHVSFDGFSFRWSSQQHHHHQYHHHQIRHQGQSDDDEVACHLGVQFNFLSTDFSHSKGVKGIPVRLVAKTEIADTKSPNDVEVCFCKVKLFRDHGAERKLTNDVAHVRKTIEKLRRNQVAAQHDESNSNKSRKRSASLAKLSGVRPIKKRSGSHSSDDSASELISAVDDAQLKLDAMNDMFGTTRPISILNLHGEADPDVDPINIDPVSSSSQPHPPVPHAPESRNASLSSSSRAFPPSPTATQGQASRMAEFSAPFKPLRTPSLPVRVQGTETVDALDVDGGYVPPSAAGPKAVMVVYVHEAEGRYYRAIYLPVRTERALRSALTRKLGLDPERTILVRAGESGKTADAMSEERGTAQARDQVEKRLDLGVPGLTLVDDDVVKDMSEGQTIQIEQVNTGNGSGRMEIRLVY